MMGNDLLPTMWSMSYRFLLPAQQKSYAHARGAMPYKCIPAVGPWTLASISSAVFPSHKV
jgi:hypothetical protein